MSNISSGIRQLDNLIDSYYVGDNVVWEIESGIPLNTFLNCFIKQSSLDSAHIIYVSFNRSPQTIIREVEPYANSDFFVLVDCFSSGKGKDDEAFLRFYNSKPNLKVIRIEEPSDIEGFIRRLNAIEDSLPSGARYIFDSLTGMQDLWANVERTYKFFTYMCPRLFDLETVAYWILEKDAHSKPFRANLRHITQVVFDLYERREKMYIKAHKMVGREARDLFKPHQFYLSEGAISIISAERDNPFYIGSLVKELRSQQNLSQKGLADRLDVTPSFVSQIENNQISPSVHSLLQICRAFDVNPSIFFQQEEKGRSRQYQIIKSKPASEDVTVSEGVSEVRVLSNDRFSVKIVRFVPGAVIKRHFNDSKRTEFVYVLRGQISLLISGAMEYLSAGDSLVIKEVIPSMWKNEGGDEAKLLVAW